MERIMVTLLNMTVTEPYLPVNPIQILLAVMLVVWEAGMLVLFLCHFAGYIRLKRRLGTAVKAADENLADGRGPEYAVYESDRIPSASGLRRKPDEIENQKCVKT